MVETKAGRQAVRADIFIDCSGDGDLAAWAGARFEVGDNAGSMLYPSMMFRLNGIDPEKAGDAWRTIPALMEAGRSRRHASFSAQGRDRAAAALADRMAGQFHPTGARGRHRDQRARARRSHARRDRGPPPGGQRLQFPAHGAGLRKILHRRPAAAARHPRNPARGRRLYALAARTCSAAPRSRIRSASMAGRWNPMSRAT